MKQPIISSKNPMKYKKEAVEAAPLDGEQVAFTEDQKG